MLFNLCLVFVHNMELLIDLILSQNCGKGLRTNKIIKKLSLKKQGLS